jgi:heavy metal sensor kinase
MTPRTTRPASLGREIVLWYSLVLLIALLVFALASYLVLRQTLARTGTATLQQTAAAAEQLIAPDVPRIEIREDRIPPRGGAVEALRRRARLATGEVIDIYVARSGDVEQRALQSFAFIAVILIPLTAAAAAIGARSIAARLLEPLERLVGATREIGIGGLSRRVPEPERPAELRDLAQSFNAMLVRLESAVATLRRFTADASHELRTPLTVIKGTAQIALSRERSAEELRETLVEVAEETDRMLQLVEGLLALARGDEAVQALAVESVRLKPLIEDIAEIGAAMVADKAVTVRVDVKEEVTVVGAKGPLRQVLLNLVANAARYTEEGSITIRAFQELGAESAGEAAVAIEVIDTGAGIPEEHLPYVFDRFFRGDAARGAEGGTGLGLAIARMIVEQHGGSIEVASQVGRGSIFRVVLPREPNGRRAVPADA